MFQEYICKYVDHFRRGWLLPFAKAAGYNMVLLKSGTWMYDSAGIPVSHIRARYDAETHCVCSDEVSGRTRRNSWLSVTSEGRDLSEFFSDLRVPEKLYISHMQRLMLFAHQKGWFPSEPLVVVKRDGTETPIYVFDPSTSR